MPDEFDDPGPSSAPQRKAAAKPKKPSSSTSTTLKPIAKENTEITADSCAMLKAGKECHSKGYPEGTESSTAAPGQDFCKSCIFHISPYVLVDRAQGDKDLLHKIYGIYDKRVRNKDGKIHAVLCMSQDLTRLHSTSWGPILLDTKREADRQAVRPPVPGKPEPPGLWEDCGWVTNNYQLCNHCTTQLLPVLGHHFHRTFDIINGRAHEIHPCLKKSVYRDKYGHRTWYHQWASILRPEAEFQVHTLARDRWHYTYIPLTLCIWCVLEHHTRPDFSDYFTIEGYPKRLEGLYVDCADGRGAVEFDRTSWSISYMR